ncbi:MAG: hypothetical protein WCE62_21765 [Polyangiales bacterium]
MRQLLIPLVSAIVFVGISGCRELVTPRPYAADVTVPHVLSPVRIKTNDLEGSGWLKALKPGSSVWTTFFTAPSGEFDFNEVLPLDAWHCKQNEGCVAVLQAGDDEGALDTANPYDRIYVCTEDYVQKQGRRHCGKRSIETAASYLGDGWETRALDNRRSTVAGDGPARNWDADGYSRFFSVTHSFETTANPWEKPNEGDVAGWYQEAPFGSAVPVLPFGGKIVNVDIGATSVFIPWAWKDRHKTSPLTDLIGLTTGVDADGRPIVNEDGSIGFGLGELFVSGLQDTEAITRYSEDVRKWWDTLTDIYPRSDKSPEFHFRVDNGYRQMCLVQYMRASSKTNGKPDSWYRFDQGFAALWGQILGIGDCNTHSVKVRFCGRPIMVEDTVKFKVASSSVDVQFEPYRHIKKLCNDTFIPEFKKAMASVLVPTAEITVGEGLQILLESFKEILGVEIRRLEPTPTGMYLVLAEDIDDPQYGVIGECLPDIGAPMQCTPNYQPRVVFMQIPSTGITIPVPP